MLELGANVNHADVHNTTPLMDVISLGQEDRTLVELDREADIFINRTSVV